MFNFDVLKEYIYDCKIRKLTPRTIQHYNNTLLKFMTFLEQEYRVKDLEKIKAVHIKGYVSYLSDLGRAERYINTIIKTIGIFLEFCIREDYLTENVERKIKLQKEPIKLIETFTNEEVIKMVRYFHGSRFLDVRNKLIMLLLFDTGIRNTELCELKMTNVRDSYIMINGKGKKTRVVPISPILKKGIIKYERVREYYIKDKFAYQTEYFLLSQKGRQLTKEAIEHIVKRCGVGCGVREEIRISPHTCRHFFAQSQLKNGCDLYTLSKLLGHSNPNTTKIYLKSLKDDDFLELAQESSPLMNL